MSELKHSYEVGFSSTKYHNPAIAHQNGKQRKIVSSIQNV